MNIFKFALQIELDGKTYYKQLASKTSNPGIKKILEMLIDDEVKHYNIVKKMSESAPKALKDTEILKDAKNVFADLKGNEDMIGLHISQIKVYLKAQEIEKKSEEFYLAKKEELQEQLQKDIFGRLAEEEKKHYFLLQNIIDFISKPATWLENAEFSHLDEY